jgi:DNA-binding transcriptional MerR regulator
MPYKIKEVSDMVGVTVRTLHHYDRTGLLKPRTVTAAGYRLYSDADLEKLQQILFFKELGFRLQEIKGILDNPGFDRRQALRSQMKLLLEKKKRLEAIISLADQTLKTVKGGIAMNKKDMFQAFDMSEIEKHQQQYTEETKHKYGQTEAYKESQKKTAAYSKDDWASIQTRGNKIYQNIADLMDKSPGNPQVQKAIGEWRQHITDSFYNCTPETFRGLGDLYVQDERFTAGMDKVKPGLARFMSEAIRLYCDRIEKKGR